MTKKFGSTSFIAAQLDQQIAQAIERQRPYPHHRDFRKGVSSFSSDRLGDLLIELGGEKAVDQLFGHANGG